MWRDCAGGGDSKVAAIDEVIHRLLPGHRPFFRLGWILLLASSCFGQGRVFWERKDGPFYTRYEIWHSVDLTPSNIRSFYRRLAPEMSGYRAWTVKVFADEPEATRDLYGRFATEVDYSRWSQLYESSAVILGPSL